jgi:Phosphodiester glycosidase
MSHVILLGFQIYVRQLGRRSQQMKISKKVYFVNPIKWHSLGILTSTFALVVMGATTRIKSAIPQSFQLILDGTGVQVYQKKSANKREEYVTVVNTKKSTINNLTGTVEGNREGKIKKQLLTQFWQDAVKQNMPSKKARVIVNAAFFSQNNEPTGIAFGLKVNSRLITYGYAIGNEYPGQIHTFAVNPQQGFANIANYAKETFDSSTPDVVGGLDINANKSAASNLRRTFVGVRDDDGDHRKETVILYSSNYARQIDASNVLKSFGASDMLMLDGGSSTGLIVDGKPLIATNRPIPHVLAVYAGK